MDGYFTEKDCNIDQFLTLISEKIEPSSLKFAENLEHNIPIYSNHTVVSSLANPITRRQLMTEWASVISELSGALVIKGGISDLQMLEQVTELFDEIIIKEKAENSGGDHFGEKGANDRVWNSLQKLCIHNPNLFSRYFSSIALAAVCEAWLGPWYQMTSQVNLVRPGGKAQTCHRDYHLGFMTPKQAENFPKHAHLLSMSLTLQGAIAHCDMPIESGPTKLLPNSQRYNAGYIATLLPSFRQIFEENYIQIPLEKGDMLFFNPALFHAAGENKSENIQRMANLLQISSPMGRSLERIDRTSMVEALYPAIKKLNLTSGERAAVIAAAAEGYPFPTNLDTDPPVGGLASESQAELLNRALNENMSEDDFQIALHNHNSKRLP